MKPLEIPFFKERNELFKWLIVNKDLLIAQKKFTVKHSDGVAFNNCFYSKEAKAFKSNEPVSLELDVIKTKVAINTTNILDSHLDVHIPGLWAKTLTEFKNPLHLQEHIMMFDHVIADGDDVKAYTKTMSWKELGYNFSGTTEALLFESVVRKQRNPYMHEQYAKGYVKNHSAGMQYVKIILCINDENYGAEFEAWEKYFPMVVNADVAEDKGFFWAIKEAKLIEGSAVVKGSNYATPTLDNNMEKREPGSHSQEEPPKSTLKIDYDYLTKNFSL